MMFFWYHVGITNFLWSLIPAFPNFSNRTTVVPEEKVLRDNRLAQSELAALRAELYWKKKLDTKWLGSVNFHWFLAIHGNPKYFMCGSIWCNGLQGKTSVFEFLAAETDLQSYEVAVNAFVLVLTVVPGTCRLHHWK